MNIDSQFKEAILRRHPHLQEVKVASVVRDGRIAFEALERSQRGELEDSVSGSISVEDATHGRWDKMKITYG